MDIHFVSLQRWSKAATSADDNLDISRLIHVHIPVVRQQLMFVWEHETGSIVNSLLIRMCPILSSTNENYAPVAWIQRYYLTHVMRFSHHFRNPISFKMASYIIEWYQHFGKLFKSLQHARIIRQISILRDNRNFCFNLLIALDIV